MDRFIFTTCQVGMEAALKAELARTHPKLKLAYSRPGFVTFKADANDVSASIQLNSIFAREYGLTLGKISEASTEACELMIRLARDAGVEFPCRLHVYERDENLPGDEPQIHPMTELARSAFGDILSHSPELFHHEPEPQKSGEWVLDVVIVGPQEWWVGVHKHHDGHLPWVGGRVPLQIDSRAPSRAYYKLEEALAASRVTLRGGEVALELGSAPGGATLCMLKRSMSVYGVDPGEMSAVIHEYAGQFTHLHKQVGQVKPIDLPDNIHWIVMDINDDPAKLLPIVAKIGAAYLGELRGMLLTLKLGSAEAIEKVPSWISDLEKMGMKPVFVRQLSRNRSEIFVAALTPIGLRMNPRVVGR